jgi:hypothetical protein
VVRLIDAVETAFAGRRARSADSRQRPPDDNADRRVSDGGREVGFIPRTAPCCAKSDRCETTMMDATEAIGARDAESDHRPSRNMAADFR